MPSPLKCCSSPVLLLAVLLAVVPVNAQTQPAAPSFSPSSELALRTFDFGVVREGQVIAPIDFSVFNRATLPEGASLAYESIFQLGDTSALTLSGTPFGNVAPGGSVGLQVGLNTSVAGSFSVTYVLSFTSVGLPEADTPSVAIAAFAEVLSRADFNSDGTVNAADYDYWAIRYGQTGTTADGNGDGIVNAADYTLWRDTFSPSAIAVAVPSPGTLPLVGSTLCLLICGSRRRCP